MGRLARLTGILLLLACPGAVAQRLLVETTSYSVLHEPAEVRLHAADLSRGTTLAALPPLPGNAPIGPLMLSPDSKSALALTGAAPLAADSTRAYVSAYSAATLQHLTDPALSLTPGATAVSGLTVTDTAGHSLLAVLTSRTEGGVARGRLETYTLNADGSPAADSVAWPLPGSPVAAVAFGPNGAVAVLCRNASSPDPVLHIRNAFTGEVALEALPLPAAVGNGKADPTGLAASPDGAWLYATVSGYVFDRPSGGSATWLYRINTARPLPATAPLELPGSAEVATPPVPTSDGVWVGTWEVGAGFAYATKAVASAEGLSVDAQVPFMEVEGPLHIAVAPQGAAVAVAADERLELWPESRPTGTPLTFAAPVAALRWIAEGLLVGEGNRVNLVAAGDRTVQSTVGIQAGLITDFAVLDEDSPLLEDADADGIADGADPAPAVPSPRLSVPSVITLHGESAGRETRAVLVDPPYGQGLTWRVEIDAQAAPWLRVYPTAGKAGEPFHLGVDEANYPADRGLLQGVMTVYATNADPKAPVANAPAKILVQVLPPPSDKPEILWLLDRAAKDGSLQDASDPYAFRALAKLLSENPHRFNHREAHGAFVGSLSQYRVVVMSAKAAAQGAVTRQALLDYIENGGAVLFLGADLGNQDAQSLTRWLSPLDVYIDPSVKLNGAFPTRESHWLCRHWKSFTLQNGCGVRADNPDSTLVPGPTGSGTAALVAQAYGRGRIAVLGAPTPIQSAALAERENQRFASDLFRWLARNGTELEDVDGDGLPNSVEDANKNGICDPGETDRFNPDSDGDGVPDGREDANYNGRVDEGETQPLNPDTDGDGLYDGADPQPLPPAGTPHVQSVTPSSAPAEGGVSVVVSGRNFTPESTLWFGDRAAESVRLLGDTALSATIPPAANVEAVTVRVTDPAKNLTGALPRGFLYTPRSQVQFTLEEVRTAASSQEGTLAVRFNAPAGVQVGRITLRLESSDPGLHWTGTTVAPAARYAGRQVQQRPNPTGGIWLDISAAADKSAPGQLALIHWQSDHPLDNARITLPNAQATAPNNQPLPSTTTPLTLTTE